jgi:hypothetical protein
MKTVSFMTGFMLTCLQSVAQPVPVNEPDPNKPKLFDAIPAQVHVNMTTLNSLFNGFSGQSVDLDLSDNTPFRFVGEIRELASKYDNRIQTVVIRSVNYPGAVLTISKIASTQGSRYEGRIISFGHGDLFQLQHINGSYVLVKRDFYHLINE